MFFSALGETCGYDDRTRWIGKIFLPGENKVLMVIAVYVLIWLPFRYLGITVSLPW
jgi:hypothetical protein